jgi:hypothetical protein
MPRAKLYENAAERQAAYRARNELSSLTVELPAETLQALREFMKFKDYTMKEAVTKLITQQLLRKR